MRSAVFSAKYLLQTVGDIQEKLASKEHIAVTATNLQYKQCDLNASQPD
jgi:hypothetical protein